MYDAPGLGLAAPRSACRSASSSTTSVPGDGAQVLINPVDHRDPTGEWEYYEGCLSVPGLGFDIVRPKQVHVDRRRPRRQRGRRSRRTSCWHDSSSTSWTTSTACSCSTTSTTRHAGRPRRRCGRCRWGPGRSSPTSDARALVQAVVLQAPLRIAYFGTPEMAVPPLRAVHDAGHEVVARGVRRRHAAGAGQGRPRPVRSRPPRSSWGWPSRPTRRTCSTSTPTSGSWSPTAGSSSPICSPTCRW